MPCRLSIHHLFAALLPRACLLCGAPASEHAVCAACLDDLPRLPEPRCPVCATPLSLAAPACGSCLARPPAYDATQAAWCYGFPLDSLVQQLKFRRRLASADFLARSMLAGPWPAGDLIVPVPLAAARLAERGFNQAVEIARPLAHALGLPLDTTRLVRVRDSTPQSRLPWRVRQGNVRHAFAANADFAGCRVIVVDDVMTSGATLNAVARVLKARGAARVVNWVAARAVRAQGSA